MSKILVIGQAPPAVKQGVPYDTTMLYLWLEELGIGKNEAQFLFYWDSVYDKFPGHGRKGHKPPTQVQMDEYWERSLKMKVLEVEKIWVLGNVAWEYLSDKKELQGKDVIKTIHPSKRNVQYYYNHKSEILKRIEDFINR